jgi:SAM-dependent methyltransferase
MLAPLRREASRIELMDRPDTSPAEMARNLVDIARLNQMGGAIQTIQRHVAPFLEKTPRGETLRILDVGTGGADIPLALARWAKGRGHRVRIVALDVHPAVLAHAARAAASTPEVRVIAGNALEAPIRPRSVDLVLCSLVLHHLPEEAVVALFRRMAELARLGFVVSDLRRERLAWAVVWLATRAVSRNRMTRHDGPLSVRRAYSLAELTGLAGRAQLPDITWHRAPVFRQIGVWVRPGVEGLHAR